MIRLDGEAIRRSLGESVTTRLAGFEEFPEIKSTNSHLMQRPAPPPGQFLVAVTDNQTMGRGRYGRTWLSPPGSGLCLSLAYTFVRQPENLPALTLAVGLGVIGALEKLGIEGVRLKWPNDLIANDGKLGGILTESQSRVPDTITVVTGVGLNIDLGEAQDLGLDNDRTRPVADLAGFVDELPSRNALAAGMIDGLCLTFMDYEADGFGKYVNKWPERDWLYGRQVTIDTPRQQVSGVGAGVADDGALLVETGSGNIRRITSGSVVLTGSREGNS